MATASDIFGGVLFRRASWTLLDQGLVSLGTFAVNITLARSLTAAEYGTFALIFGFLLLLQVVNTTLIFYPLMLRIAQFGHKRDDLIRCSMVLMALLLLPLSGCLAVALTLLDQTDLLAPTLIWFVAWQWQETCRRILFSELRHKAALLGDALSYVGQAIVVGGMAFFSVIGLADVMLVLAATSALAVVVQLIQIGPQLRTPTTALEIRSHARDFWETGRWSLASSIATAMRLNGVIWLIAWIGTRADVAQFQAALNVANVANPILFGLCNIIPQSAARESEQSLARAWRVTLQYASLGFLPTAFYAAVVMAAPGFVLTVLYGGNSPYLEVFHGVRIMSVAFLVNYVSEMICSYLHGINAPRAALHLNLLGNLALAILVVPCVLTAGWVGGCIALATANSFRLLLSVNSLRRMGVHSKAMA